MARPQPQTDANMRLARAKLHEVNAWLDEGRLSPIIVAAWANNLLKGRQPRTLTADQAAQYLGVSLNSIHRWSNNGMLQCYRTRGGHRRFTLEQLDALDLPAGEVTAPEAARYFGVSPRTILRWVQAGQLEGSRIPSGNWHFNREQLAAARCKRYERHPAA